MIFIQRSFSSAWSRRSFAILLMGISSGCGTQNDGPTASDLVRRQQLRDAAAAGRPRTFDERCRMVRDALENGNSVAAEAELRPLLILDSSHPEVVTLAAHVEAAQGHLVTAAKMLMVNPRADHKTTVESMFQAAQWLIEKGEHTLAADPLQQILLLPAAANGPEASRAHRQLAKLFNNTGRRLAAAPHLQWLAQSGDIQEKELFAMIAYGDPFVDTSSPRPDISQQLTLEALSLAKVLRQEGKLPEATRLIEALATRFPESCEIAAFRGRVYADLHDVDSLIEWRSQLPLGIEAEPEYWFALGVLMAHQAHDRKAVRCFAEAAVRDPTNRFSYLELSRALIRSGENSLAITAHDRFAVLNETTRLAYIFGGRAGSEAELHRLADRLHELHRDSEAIGWRMLALTRFGGSPSAIAELVSRRNSLDFKGRLPREFPSRDSLSGEASGDQGTSEGHEQKMKSFVLCGLKLEDWPLPGQRSRDSSPSTLTTPHFKFQAGGAVGEPTAERAARPSTQESPSDQVPIRLADVAADVGIDFTYINGADMASERVLLHQLTGGGIGVIDIDRDGWPDLYFTQAGGDAFDTSGSHPNCLFRNHGGQGFHDVSAFTQTADTGYGQGVAVADLNQDGFADLVVANIGTNRVYINQGDGTFAQAHLPAWQEEAQWTTSIACGDLNGDGLPEIVEVNYVDDPRAFVTYCTRHNTDCNPSQFQPAHDRVWQWQSGGEVILDDELWSSGVQPSYGFAAIIANTDAQAGSELFIANDRVANHFWLSERAESPTDNERQPVFRLAENSQVYGCATGLLGQQQGCMGIAAGDFDRDGRIDFHVTNFWNQPADLYLQGEHGFFVHSSANRGLDDPTKQTVGWGTQAVDFDRDGWLDLAVLNGHLINRHLPSEPYRMRPQLFIGDPAGFQLLPPTMLADSKDSRDNYWNHPTLGRTMAVMDWNRDLKPDLVCNHLDAPVALLENQTVGGNAVQFELVGVISERDAVAAELTVVCGRDRWTSWVTGGDGFLCSNEPFLDVGIGPHDRIDEVWVKWPSGAEQRFSDIEPNQRYLLTENEERAFILPTANVRPQ